MFINSYIKRYCANQGIELNKEVKSAPLNRTLQLNNIDLCKGIEKKWNYLTLSFIAFYYTNILDRLNDVQQQKNETEFFSYESLRKWI